MSTFKKSTKQKVSRPNDKPGTISPTINSNHRKEDKFYKEYLVVRVLPKKDNNGNRIRTVINCRLYGTQARIYCCIWVDQSAGLHGRNGGSGYAGGYGYCKESAAVSEAIQSAGYELTRSISGVGVTAIREALKAIATFHGFKNVQIIESHA